MRNGHGYQRMILDEHCPCGNGPEALAAAEKRGPIERTDYEAWFWSQASGRKSARRPGYGGTIISSKEFALPENSASHSLDGRHGR